MKTYRVIYPRLEEQALAYKSSVDSMMTTATALDSIQAQQIAIRDKAIQVQSDRIINQAQANQELRKEVNRQKRHKVLAIGIGAILVVLAAL